VPFDRSDKAVDELVEELAPLAERGSSLGSVVRAIEYWDRSPHDMREQLRRHGEQAAMELRRYLIDQVGNRSVAEFLLGYAPRDYLATEGVARVRDFHECVSGAFDLIGLAPRNGWVEEDNVDHVKAEFERLITQIARLVVPAREKWHRIEASGTSSEADSPR
jgi:hypothetical protein